MVVFHNTLPNGNKESITRHLPIDERKPCIKRQFRGKESVKR